MTPGYLPDDTTALKNRRTWQKTEAIAGSGMAANGEKNSWHIGLKIKNDQPLPYLLEKIWQANQYGLKLPSAPPYHMIEDLFISLSGSTPPDLESWYKDVFLETPQQPLSLSNLAGNIVMKRFPNILGNIEAAAWFRNHTWKLLNELQFPRTALLDYIATMLERLPLPGTVEVEDNPEAITLRCESQRLHRNVSRLLANSKLANNVRSTRNSIEISKLGLPDVLETLTATIANHHSDLTEPEPPRRGVAVGVGMGVASVALLVRRLTVGVGMGVASVALLMGVGIFSAYTGNSPTEVVRDAADGLKDTFCGLLHI